MVPYVKQVERGPCHVRGEFRLEVTNVFLVRRQKWRNKQGCTGQERLFREHRRERGREHEANANEG